MKTKAEKDKAYAQRMRVFRHNGLLGQRKRAEMFLKAVISLDSTTDEAKDDARIALDYLVFLERSLKKRIDP